MHYDVLCPTITVDTVCLLMMLFIQSIAHSFIHLIRMTSTNKNLCGRDGRTICGPQRVLKIHVCHFNLLRGAT